MPSRRGIVFDDEEVALMERHPEINWSAVFRQAVREKVEALELAEQLREERDPRAKAVAEKLKKGTGARWREAVAEAEGRTAKGARGR